MTTWTLRGPAVLVLLVGCGFEVPSTAGGPGDGATPGDAGGDGAQPDSPPIAAASDGRPRMQLRPVLRVTHAP